MFLIKKLQNRFTYKKQYLQSGTKFKKEKKRHFLLYTHKNFNQKTKKPKIHVRLSTPKKKKKLIVFYFLLFHLFFFSDNKQRHAPKTNLIIFPLFFSSIPKFSRLPNKKQKETQFQSVRKKIEGKRITRRIGGTFFPTRFTNQASFLRY